MKVLDAADDHGLPAELYTDCRSHDLVRAMAKISAEQAPQFDVKATAVSFATSLHLTGGRLDPRALQSLWTLKPEKPDLVAALTDAVKNNDLAQRDGTPAASAARIS